MVKWVCKGCNFRFEARAPKDCPYCGRDNMIEKEPNAEELLNDVERILDG